MFFVMLTVSEGSEAHSADVGLFIAVDSHVYFQIVSSGKSSPTIWALFHSSARACKTLISRTVLNPGVMDKSL